MGMHGVTSRGTHVSQSLKDLVIDFNITNRFSILDISQLYQVEGDSALEIYYKFPVPAGYSVSGFDIKIGDKTIKGALKEKESAIHDYKEAISEGNSGFLLQNCDNQNLECCLGNVTPRTTIKILITLYGELKCEINSNRYRLIIPTTIAQKYSPSNYISPKYENLEIEYGTPQYSMTINLDLKITGGIKSIQCNQIVVNPNVEDYRFTINPETFDRDIIVIIEYNISSTYVISNENTKINFGIEDSAVVNASLIAGKYKYATIINIVPEPNSLPKCEDSDMHYCLILDRSGSMSGDMIALRDAAKTAINLIPLKSLIDIYDFGSNYRRFTCGHEYFSREYRTKALEWIDRIKSDGGTEVKPVIKDAYRRLNASGKMGSIIFVSDGDVNNIDEILDMIETNQKVRVFTIGIGNCVSQTLIEEMARVGRGTAEFVTNSSDLLESKMATTIFRAQKSSQLMRSSLLDPNRDPRGSHDTYYKLDIITNGTYEMIPKQLPPLVENYNNSFYIFSEKSIDEIRFNSELLPIERYFGNNGVINTVVALKYMNYLKHGKFGSYRSRISHLNNDDRKSDIIECSIINNVLSEYTSFVGIEEKEIKQLGKIEYAVIPLEPPSRSSDLSGLQGLFDKASSLMQKMGYLPPPGFKSPSETEISNVMCNVLNNETTQNTIQGMIASLQGCQDFGSAVDVLVKDVTGPVTMNTTQDPTQSTTKHVPTTTDNVVVSIDSGGLAYTQSSDLLISVDEESLNDCCGRDIHLNLGDIIEIIGVGIFKVIVMGSKSEKWVLRKIR
ncbi:Vault protein [uncultured virus]|nr:Vault protein [uncultured virus]